MADRLTKTQRSVLMSKIRSKGTTPERVAFAAMRAAGLRFRRHDRSLPGSPDAVFPAERVAVFVEGDFWHGWRFGRWKVNLAPFWRDKISRNIARDVSNRRKLRRMGWTPVRIWEHELKRDPAAAVGKVLRTLKHKSKIFLY